jgi:hypothetical protein
MYLNLRFSENWISYKLLGKISHKRKKITSITSGMQLCESKRHILGGGGIFFVESGLRWASIIIEGQMVYRNLLTYFQLRLQTSFYLTPPNPASIYGVNNILILSSLHLVFPPRRRGF